MATKRKQAHLRWHPRGSSAWTEHELPSHDPPLSPHDEAVFLLHIAAEIEHALMVQYLYAAYSLKPPEEAPTEHQSQIRTWKKTLLGIAREEMGHLITVQNLLRLIGGPIILDREDYPFRSALYPFHFRLEPLSKASLAKYVLAEMPHFPEQSDEIREIVHRACSDSDVPVNRVGSLYLRLAHILSAPITRGEGATHDYEPHLPDSDFVRDASKRQALYEDWGNGASVLVLPVRNREEALAAIDELSEQGEGLFDSAQAPSHYQRFLTIYREFPEAGEWEAAYPVPVDPTTRSAYHPTGEEAEDGRILHPVSRLWAQLFNVRYRLLLAYLSHFLQSEGPLRDATGLRTPRGFLQKWTFDEMRHLSLLASTLVTLPRSDRGGDSGRAGAPFELPYTLNLPDREPERWRHHLDVLAAATGLIEQIRYEERAHSAGTAAASADSLLRDLQREDSEARQIMRAAAAGEELPAQASGFRRVVRILEEGVRGFRIGAHHNFWRGLSRDDFVNKSVFGYPLIARTEDGRFDPDNSNLLKALRGQAPFDAPETGSEDPARMPRMPAHHPPVYAEDIEFVRQWIADGCPEGDDPPHSALLL